MARWPDFNKGVAKHAELLLNGTVLYIDPASGGTSSPGYAISVGGELVESGDIELTTKSSIQARLRELYEFLKTDFPHPDILVIERIAGSRVHPHLHYSCGAILGGTCAPVVLFIPVTQWRKFAGKQYCLNKKAGKTTDADDAEQFAWCTLALARSYL